MESSTAVLAEQFTAQGVPCILVTFEAGNDYYWHVLRPHPEMQVLRERESVRTGKTPYKLRDQIGLRRPVVSELGAGAFWGDGGRRETFGPTQ